MSQQEAPQDRFNPFEDSDEGISIAELFTIFRKRFSWFVVGLVLVLALAIGYLQIATPLYESQVSVLVEAIQRSSSFESLLDVSTSSAKIATEVELITSRSNVSLALESLDLSQYHNSDGEDYQNRQVLGNVRERIVVSTVKDTNIVKIAITDQNPAFAQDFANALAATYDNFLTGIAKNSKTAQREFIENQIPLNDEKLAIASDILGTFRETSDIIQLSDKSSMLIEQISYYTLRLEPLKLQLSEAEVFIDSYNTSLMEAGIAMPVSLEEIKADPVIAEKLGELGAWKTELSMYESFTRPGGMATNVDSSSRTYVINSAISQLTKDLVNRVNSLTRPYAIEANTQAIVGALTTEVEIIVLNKRAEVFTEELGQLPVLERRLSELQRDVQIYEAIGLKLREMLEEVKLSEAAITGNVTVVDRAILPTRPVRPNRLLILAVALLLGSSVGLLLTLAREALDISIQNEHQIRKIVGRELPILGWIPLMKVTPKTKYPTLSVYNDPLAFESERFKLVANMLYNKSDQQIYSITSSAMAEGKSTIIGNIALALAQMGSRVLVIDGDLRLPSMERYFRLKHHEIGLVDFVTKNTALEECLIQPLEDTPTLHLLPSGNAPLVPAAIFSNPRYIKGLEQLRQIYDFIIIDAPPLDSASELLSISKFVDGLIITVRAGITTKGALYDLITNLRTANATITGFVFNGVLASAISSYRYGYGRSYSYGYGYGYGYGQSGKSAKMGSKSLIFRRRGSTSWYRKRYKQDLKNRTKVPTDLLDPILVFGPQSPYQDLEEWARKMGMGNATDAPIVRNSNHQPAESIAKIREPQKQDPPLPGDPLSAIEQDPTARGKREEPNN